MTFNVNYDVVIASPNLDAITKMLASKMLNVQYMTIGDFLKSLSNADINKLLEMVEHVNNDDYSINNLLLMSEMLSIAEGCATLCEEDSHKNLEAFCVFVTCTSLERKGLVQVFYDKMSFGDECSEEIICKLI